MAAYLILTKADRLILDSYKTVLDGFSEYFGEGYELVLHSLEDLEHSVIKIINGHYTNREEGAPITYLALTMLERIRKQSSPHSLVYFNRKNGSTLKSATIPIIGEGGRIIGLLCINLHLDIPFSTMLSSFFNEPPATPAITESFNEDMEGLIASSVREAKTKVMADASVSSSNKNKEIVRILHDKGIFQVKEAVVQVAHALDISKNTVYLHLRNLANCGQNERRE